MPQTKSVLRTVQYLPLTRSSPMARRLSLAILFSRRFPLFTPLVVVTLKSPVPESYQRAGRSGVLKKQTLPNDSSGALAFGCVQAALGYVSASSKLI